VEQEAEVVRQPCGWTTGTWSSHHKFSSVPPVLGTNRGRAYHDPYQQLPASAAYNNGSHCRSEYRATSQAHAGGGGDDINGGTGMGPTEMREMIFRIVALQPVNIDPDSVAAEAAKHAHLDAPADRGGSFWAGPRWTPPPCWTRPSSTLEINLYFFSRMIIEGF
jgi:hypothetical protein